MIVKWNTMDTAPTDGTVIRVITDNAEGLPVFETEASYHPDAGWCVDELRNAVGWLPLQAPWPQESCS